MRRFFIGNLGRLLNLLTSLAGVALLAWAGHAAWAAQGDLQTLLRIAATLLGALVAIVALAGGAYLMLSIHDDLRRIAAQTGGLGGTGPRATRKPVPTRTGAAHPDDMGPPSNPVPTGRTPITTPPLMARPAQPEPPAPHNPKPARTPRLVADRRPLR